MLKPLIIPLFTCYKNYCTINCNKLSQGDYQWGITPSKAELDEKIDSNGKKWIDTLLQCTTKSVLFQDKSI